MICHHTVIRAFHDLAINAKDDAAAERCAQQMVSVIRSLLPSRDWTNELDCAANTYVRAVRLSEDARVLHRECRVRSVNVPLTHLSVTAGILGDAEVSAEDELAKAIKSLNA